MTDTSPITRSSGLNQYPTVGNQTLGYDTNFNLASYDGWSYVYDAEGRLISASGNGHDVTFVYDGLGRCVQRTIDNAATVLIYDEWKPIAEATPTGTISAWNLYGPGADEILWRNEAGIGDIHYHSDHEGNVLFLLDADNNGLEKYRYDAFGAPTITDWNGSVLSDSAYGNRFMFTGREYLSALGIYDYRHRYYHPGLGRFLGVDSKGFDAGDDNLYRYVENDPLDKTDPTGLFSIGGLGRAMIYPSNGGIVDVDNDPGIHNWGGGSIAGHSVIYVSGQMTSTGHVSRKGVGTAYPSTNPKKPNRMAVLPGREENGNGYLYRYQLENFQDENLGGNQYTAQEITHYVTKTGSFRSDDTDRDKPRALRSGIFTDQVGVGAHLPSTNIREIRTQTFDVRFYGKQIPVSTILLHDVSVTQGHLEVTVRVLVP